MVVPVNSFLVLACGATAIAGGLAIHQRVAFLRRWLIPHSIIAGLLLAIPSLMLRSRGWILEVDTTIQQLTMVAFFTSIGFSVDRKTLQRGGKPVVLVLLMVAVGAFVQNVLGMGLAHVQGLNPLFGIAAGAMALAGGPATSLAFGPTLEAAGATGATTIGVASAIVGILVAGLVTGTFGATLIRRERLLPSASEMTEEMTPASLALSSTPTLLLQVLVLFGIAMGVGYLFNLAVNALLKPAAISLPAYVGSMIVATTIRFAEERFPALIIPDRWNSMIGYAALSWFIPLALWTLKYWELAGLVGPIIIILAAQLPLTLGLALVTYRLAGRTFDGAIISSGYFGFMFGTMANSMASIGELHDQFGTSREALLLIPIVGGVLSDFAIIVAMTLSRGLLFLLSN
jgi:ESS family glutamate:Na+ symporter